MEESRKENRNTILLNTLALGEIPVLKLFISKPFYVLYAPLALLIISLIISAMGKVPKRFILILAPLELSCLVAFMSPADLARYVFPCMFLAPMTSAIILTNIPGNNHNKGRTIK